MTLGRTLSIARNIYYFKAFRSMRCRSICTICAHRPKPTYIYTPTNPTLLPDHGHKKLKAIAISILCRSKKEIYKGLMTWNFFSLSPLMLISSGNKQERFQVLRYLIRKLQDLERSSSRSAVVTTQPVMTHSRPSRRTPCRSKPTQFRGTSDVVAESNTDHSTAVNSRYNDIGYKNVPLIKTTWKWFV